MDATQRAQLVKRLAAEAGFERCGIAAAGPIARGDYVREWLARDAAGSMGYLHRRLDSRLDPRALLEGARSVIAVAQVYHQRANATAAGDERPRGRVAMYAWGEDYHVVLRERLEGLVGRLRKALAEPFAAKVCVDTSPLIERELAAAAGIGWIGKNTLVLHESIGSYFFLGEIVTTLALAADAPATDHCGSCTRCLEACPTGAFPRAYEMDARRCISYLTIEHRGEVAAELRPLAGDWVFGCDVCQAVCPYNRNAPLTREARYAPRRPGPRPALDEIEQWDAAAYREAVRGSATGRARLEMWRRNAGIARENVVRAMVGGAHPTQTSDGVNPAAR